MILISVVIPTYNRLAQLKRTLGALEKQSFGFDQFEVIVVSDGSRDGTDEYLQTLKLPFKLIALFQENGGVAAARNNGVQHASGEIILFVDDDIVPDVCLLTEHYQWQLDKGFNAIVIGPMLTPKDHRMSPWVRWEQDHLEEYYHAMVSEHWQPTPRQFYTGNLSLRKIHMLNSGGFDPTFRRAEDVELAYRLQDMGLQFFFNPDALGYHYAERKFESWLSVAYEYGKNDVLFSIEKKQTWLLAEILNEFYKRNTLIQMLTGICLGRPLLSWVAEGFMKQAVFVAQKMNMVRIGSFACSGLFNLRYYQGLSDQLGGRQVFMNALRDKRPGAQSV